MKTYISSLVIGCIFLLPQGILCQCENANTPDDVTQNLTHQPGTLENFGFDYYCQSSCLSLATPESNPLVCGFDQRPTVWFSLYTDNLAKHLFTKVEGNKKWKPIWAVFYKDSNGDLVALGDESGGFGPCNFQQTTDGLLQTILLDNVTEYFIAVTSDSDSDGTNENVFEFNLCSTTTIDAVVCFGELDSPNPESLFDIRITKRSCEGDINGPFYPDEEIEIEIDFTYDASEAGSDWLKAVIPTFGNGWDITSLEATFGNNFEWIAFDDPCAGLLQERIPSICTYMNDEGNLILCNGLDEACPCSLGMEPGDLMASGWYISSTGSNAGCTDDCTPHTSWGAVTGVIHVNQSITLKTKKIDTEEDCVLNQDLQISYQTFSDGVMGCWEDPVGECNLDRKMFSPKWKMICEGECEGIVSASDDLDNNLVGVSISPNPIQNIATLKFNERGDYEISISDNKGVVKSIKISDTPHSKVDLSDLNPGIYFIKTRDIKNNKQATNKIVKI